MQTKAIERTETAAKLAITAAVADVEQAFAQAEAAYRGRLDALRASLDGDAPDHRSKAVSNEALAHEATHRLVQRCCEQAVDELGLRLAATPEADVREQAQRGSEFSFTVSAKLIPRLRIEGYEGLRIRIAKEELERKPATAPGRLGNNSHFCHSELDSESQTAGQEFGARARNEGIASFDTAPASPGRADQPKPPLEQGNAPTPAAPAAPHTPAPAPASADEATLIEMRAREALAACLAEPVPEYMVDAQAERYYEALADSLAQSQVDISEYASFIGTSIEQIRELMRREASTAVSENLALEALFAELGYEVSDAAIEATLVILGQQSGVPADVQRDELNREQRVAIHEMTMHRMATEWLLANVEVERVGF